MDLLPPLWICGNSRVEQYAPHDLPDLGQPLWVWDSASASDLDDEQRGWFHSLDEVKPVMHEGTPCLLVTSSWRGGVAILRRGDARVLFAAQVTNAHSVELLPGGLLAVAGSEGTDQVQLFALNTERRPAPLCCAILPHGHGVVWDRLRHCLWAGGHDQILRLDPAVATRDGPWLPADRIALPEGKLHELLPDPCAGGLIFSTAEGVWRFDPETRAVAPHAALGRIPHVKSASTRAADGQIAFTRGEGGNWWSQNIYLLTRDGRLAMGILPDRKLYKVRWDQSCQLEALA